MAGPSWGMHRSTDYRVLMAIATGMCLLAATSAVFVIVEHLVGITLVALGVGWLVVAVLRRELRIRRRLADVAGTRPAPPRLRAGPGERSPVSPAPTRHVMNPAAPEAAPPTGGTR